MIKQSIIKQLDFNYKYAEKLVEDLNESEFSVRPSKGHENHPAFTLGHLATSAAMVANKIGHAKVPEPSWAESFKRNGPGDPRIPSTDLGDFPSKKELLSELKKQHDVLKALLFEMEQDEFEQGVEWRFKTYLPTKLDYILFFCINHECMHLSQLAAWRRAMSLSSALAKL